MSVERGEVSGARLYPDVAIPPGEHLAETLRELEMSQTELARKMGRPVQAINQIVNGSKAITADTALQLEEATGVPAHIWTRLEADYRLVLARLQAKRRQSSSAPRRSGYAAATASFMIPRHANRAAGRKSAAKKGRR